MLNIALKNKPNSVCIVPEKRSEVTTEGGLNLKKNRLFLKKIINKLKHHNIRVSLFVEPNASSILLSKKLGSDCVELHTGKYCNLYNKNKNSKSALSKLKKSSILAKNLGLEVHAGHGLTFNSTFKLSKIKYISEFNIGHFVISESLFIGLDSCIKKFKKIINS